MVRKRRILITGATGYIGSHLVPQLTGAGHEVRVVVRQNTAAARLQHDLDVDVVVGDLGDAAVRNKALTQVDVAYYLVNPFNTGSAVERHAIGLATDFSLSAHQARVHRIVVLSHLPGLLRRSSRLAHCQQDINQVFLAGPVPTISLRTAAVISRDAPAVRYLMALRQKWWRGVFRRHWQHTWQPIGLADALYFLQAAGEYPEALNRCFDIGGPEKTTVANLADRATAVTAESTWQPALPIANQRLASGTILRDALLNPGHSQDFAAPRIVFGEPLLGQQALNDALTDAVIGPTSPLYVDLTSAENVKHYSYDTTVAVPTETLWNYLARWSPPVTSALRRLSRLLGTATPVATHQEQHDVVRPRATSLAPVSVGERAGQWVAHHVHDGFEVSYRLDLPGLGRLQLHLRATAAPPTQNSATLTTQIRFIPESKSGRLHWAAHAFAYHQQVHDLAAAIQSALRTTRVMQLPPDEVDVRNRVQKPESTQPHNPHSAQ